MGERHFCYILYIPDGSSVQTYNGYTNNLSRRIRQHNKELSGGAKATSRNKNNNWVYGAIITSTDPEFTKIKALQLEWQIRYPTRKRPRPRIYNGIQGRIDGLSHVFSNERFSNMTFELYTDYGFIPMNNVNVYSMDDAYNSI